MQRIEWTTLMFFGSMFIAMECMARLGLIRFVGQQTENLIFLVAAEYRLALAIVLVLGVRSANYHSAIIYKNKFSFHFVTIAGVSADIICRR